MISSRGQRAAALPNRISHVPTDVIVRMQDHLRQREFPQRGMVAAMQDFYARLAAAGLPPALVTEDIYDAVATSRSRLRILLKGLSMFAPDVPLAPAAQVTQRWDAWLNGKYGKKPKKKRFTRRIGTAPEDWPPAWRDALPALDKTVRPYRSRLARLAPKTREAVISAVGLLDKSRAWAAGQGVEVGTELSAELFEAFMRYLLLERKVSFGTAAGYCERLRMFFLRAGLFDEASLRTLTDLIGVLTEEATDKDPGKWQCLRAFRKQFSLADVLHKAIAADKKAQTHAGHAATALRLRQKALAYALLVNTGDRQGDLRRFRIGVDIERGLDGLWCHDTRQRKTCGKKALGPLWPGTSALIDAHLLADRPAWMIDHRVAELHGANLLTLSDNILNNGFVNCRLKDDFGIHGHLVRTLINDLIRRHRPDALWASQHMLGHTDRFMQQAYRSDFAESGAVKDMDRMFGDVDV